MGGSDGDKTNGDMIDLCHVFKKVFDGFTFDGEDGFILIRGTSPRFGTWIGKPQSKRGLLGEVAIDALMTRGRILAVILSS